MRFSVLSKQGNPVKHIFNSQEYDKSICSQMFYNESKFRQGAIDVVIDEIYSNRTMDQIKTILQNEDGYCDICKNSVICIDT
jgi:hypothetical protein